MRRYLDLYWQFLLQRFKILMEYRVNFLIGASSTVFLQAACLLTIWVVMRQVPSLNGWSLDEVLLIYGLVTLAKSINHMFADNLWTIGRQYIRTGGFDRFLVRPIDPLTEAPLGPAALAVEGGVGAGPGSVVLVVDEGNSARGVLKDGTAPVRTVIVGIVDSVSSGGKGKHYD